MYLSCTYNPNTHASIPHAWSLFNAQSICQLDTIWQFFWHIPHTNLDNLDHCRQWVEWIRQWSLGKAWIWIDQTWIISLESSDSMLFTVTVPVYLVSTSWAHCCLFHIPILIHLQQSTYDHIQHIFLNSNQVQTSPFNVNNNLKLSNNYFTRNTSIGGLKWGSLCQRLATNSLRFSTFSRLISSVLSHVTRN